MAEQPRYSLLLSRGAGPNGENVISNVNDNVLNRSFLIEGNNPHAYAYREWLAAGNVPEPPKVEDMISAADLMRDIRNIRLIETDNPWGNADYQHPNKQAWLDYRQALRDLPATADPQLDELGHLINVEWPEKPE